MINKTTTSASICIPTLNEEDHLPFLLNSIRDQENLDSVDLEIIISDSGSDDKTIEVAQSLLKASNIKYKILENINTNKSQNLNKAIEICKSEILIVIDAHCLLDKNYISEGIDLLLENKKNFCGVGGICKIESSPLSENIISRTISFCYSSPFGAGPSSYKKTNLYSPKTKKVSHIYLGFFLTQEVKAINGFNESFDRKQDIEFLERLKMNTKKNLLQHSHLKLIYYLKQNTLQDMSKRFFAQGRLIFVDKDSFRLIHIIPLVAAFSVLAVLIFSPLIFLIFIFFYFSLGLIFILIESKNLYSIILAPLIFLIFHSSYLLGTISVLLSSSIYKK